jgi:hypothetical protein
MDLPPQRQTRLRTQRVRRAIYNFRPVGFILETRREQSIRGLSDVRDGLVDSQQLFEDNSVAAYITGSFGRLEARYPGGSDLDVFFMHMPDRTERPEDLSRLVWFELIAAVIGAARKLDFPPFSRDGEFLKAHNVFHMGNALGSRHEDAENGFTARLLLLLEGRYLINERLHDAVLLETIGFYYRDYADKRERFRPYALIHDILRYWRTLCLNYEHLRNSRYEMAQGDEEQLIAFKADSAVHNLKLRYSRLGLCFSMIALLVSEPEGIAPERVREMCQTVPSERWGMAAQREGSAPATELIPEILASYEGFLDLVSDEDGLLTRLRDHAERSELRDHAANFGDLVFRLIKLVAPDEQFRRLVV